MRGYSLVHFALSPIQQGIQGGHGLIEIGSKYRFETAEAGSTVLYDTWAVYHKTMLILNGGNSNSLASIHALTQAVAEDKTLEGNGQFSYAPFFEDQETLSGMLTCVSFIADQNMCDAIDFYRQYPQTALVHADPTYQISTLDGSLDPRWQNPNLVHLAARVSLCRLAG